MEIHLDPEPFMKPFLIMLITLFSAQGGKLLFDMLKGKKASLGENGGMPSAHTAIIVALNVVILVETGLSMTFLVTLVLAAIVINDAMGVRYETTRHSELLNKLMKTDKYKTVGHTAIEVIMGGTIGLLIPLIVYTLL